MTSYDAWLDGPQDCADDLKFVNEPVLDFPWGLSIVQDRTLGKGGHVWDGAYLLAEHLFASPPPPEARVLELGAGTGLAGLAADKLGAHVLLTDGQDMIDLLERNIRRNDSRARAAVLVWPSTDEYWHPKGSEADAGTFDLILAAECVAPIYDPRGLVAALLRHAHDATEIRLVCKDKRNPDYYQSFFDLLYLRFDVTSFGAPRNSRLKSADNYTLIVCKKKKLGLLNSTTND